MSLFQANIAMLSKQNSSLAKLASAVKEVEDFEIFMDEDELASLNFIHKKEFIPLYEGKPLENIQESVAEFVTYEEYPYLYMYGLGNGLFVKHLLQNPKLKRIVVIEPEIEILHVVLHMIDFSEELAEERLVFFGASDVSFTRFLPLFKEVDQQRYARVYDLYPNTAYYEKLYQEHMRRTNQLMLEAIYHTVNLAGNDTKDALIGLKHHITNLPVVVNTPTLYELFQKLPTTDTAVLVSTGPSLTKQLPLLKEIAPYVRIIAVDASFPVLYEAGIKPDVVMSIERVKESARFFDQVPKEGFDDVVIGLSSLQHPDVIKSVKGGVMQMSLRPLGYMTTTGPQEWGYIGLGMSAANMAFELIYHSKFKNCILIGQDLAYGEDGTSHAEGHVFGVNDVKEKETDIWIDGWGGEKKVRTSHFWNLFRNFFEKDIAEANARMRTINATEGGARIQGAVELSFAQATKKYVKRKKEKKKIILSRLNENQKAIVMQKLDDKVDEMVVYVQALFEELRSLFLEMVEIARKLETQAPLELAKVEEILARIQDIKAREKDPMYDKVVWHIAQSMLLVQDIQIAPLEVHKPINEEQAREKMELLVESYKAWLFAYAGITDAILKTIEYAKARVRINNIDAIDVYCEDERIDSFGCSDMKASLGRVFDVDMRGILYDVPDTYQEKIDAIYFKDAKTGEELPQAFVDVIARDDEKYNELSFMKSLQEPIDEEKIKDLYCPNAIGFLATRENLEDEEFVGYIKELMLDFPLYHFKALIFNDQMKVNVLNIFENTCMQICVINNVADMIENIEVYVSNNERNRLDTEVLYYLRNVSTDVLCMGLYLNQQNVTIEEQEKNNTEYFSKFFDNLEYLGFTKEDKAKYGESFHAIWYKKASETYNVPIGFDPKQSMVKAYLTWNLKLGFHNHEFFKYALDFAKKYARL
ncbi:MAG: motility associated factor glycosyltransferase family protein [Helicobacteraceae bacterium]|nr:motility associated factor glycosyltransferase family protein [Helicobacteraceae bacterium]